jgi:TAT (twin-arginine translocation) pathway signal sequence
MNIPTHVTRRSFLGGAGVAGAAVLGFPAVLRAQTREIRVGHVRESTDVPFWGCESNPKHRH